MTLLRDGIGPPCTVFPVEALGRVIALIVFIVIYLGVKSRNRHAHIDGDRAKLQKERARADSVIEAWLSQGGGWNWPSPAPREPTDELLSAIAVVHCMDVHEPRQFRPFFDPAPPESHQHLAQVYGRLGVTELADAPWLRREGRWTTGVPDRIFQKEEIGRAHV